MGPGLCVRGRPPRKGTGRRDYGCWRKGLIRVRQGRLVGDGPHASKWVGGASHARFGSWLLSDDWTGVGTPEF